MLFRSAAQLNPQFDLESRRVDAEQLAQNQQQQSQQGTTSPGQQGASGNTSQNNSAQQDTTGNKIINSINDSRENEPQRKRRQQINLVIEDTRKLPGSEEEEVEDGRIQNRNIAIDLQPIFIISAFEKNAVDYERSQYYNLVIDALNQRNNYNPLLDRKSVV